MKAILKVTAVTTVVALVSAAAAHAADSAQWTGAYAGGQLQLNTVSADGVSSTTGLGAAIFGGYQMQFSDHFLLGGDLFYQYNQAKNHTVAGFSGTANLGTKGYGVDVLAGFPVGDTGVWMPYAKIGYGWLKAHGTNGGSDIEHSLRYGVGVAWMVQRYLSLQAQYMYQQVGGPSRNLKNQNLSVGVTWYFSSD